MDVCFISFPVIKYLLFTRIRMSYQYNPFCNMIEYPVHGILNYSHKYHAFHLPVKLFTIVFQIFTLPIAVVKSSSHRNVRNIDISCFLLLINSKGVSFLKTSEVWYSLVQTDRVHLHLRNNRPKLALLSIYLTQSVILLFIHVITPFDFGLSAAVKTWTTPWLARICFNFLLQISLSLSKWSLLTSRECNFLSAFIKNWDLSATSLFHVNE